MLNAIIRFSVHNKLIVILGIIGLILYGIIEIFKLPIDAVPDITDNQVQIITVSPSLGAPDVERLVTFPIESATANIPGLKEIRSFSRFGLSLVTIVFEEEVDVYHARQQVSERLQAVRDQIPKDAGTPELAPVTTGLGEIYQYVVRPKPGFESRFSLMELRTIQDWQVRRQLLGIQGVADVSSFGGELKQFEVSVSPAKLSAAGTSVAEVFDALENGNQNSGGSYIEKGPNAYFIRTDGLLKGKEDIGNLVIKQSPDGLPLFIKDVAEVNVGKAKRFGAMVLDGENEVAGGIVMMLKGANSSEVTKKVKKQIEHIKTTLPEGVTVEPFLDRTKMVNNAISTVETNLLEGALIVIFVLVLFLGNIRAGFIVASVIPLSMLFAIILMNLFGVSGNLMSLGAIDFGLIVDGAVIIVEAVLHRMQQFSAASANNKDSGKQAVIDSASKMMNAAVFGQLIILIVYLPILTLKGIEGKMFTPMAQTVIFALSGAFILSLTYVPMMSAWLLGNAKNTGLPSITERFLHKLETGYARLLKNALNRKKALLYTTVSLFLISVFMMTRLGGEFIPQLEEGDFAVETRLITGSNLNKSIEACKMGSKILKDSFPEVEKVVAKIGSGEIPTDPMPMEAADLMVIMKDKKEWKSAKTFPDMAEKMQQVLGAVPGVSFGFQYPVQMRFNELMTGAKQDVVCKIYGENLDTLPKLAEKLGSLISGIQGAEDIYVEATGGMPQILVSFDRNALARFGVKVSDANKVIQAAYAGSVAGKVYENERRFDLVVRMENALQQTPDHIQQLMIPAQNGDLIPLNNVAQIRTYDGPNQIQRQDARRRIIVGFNVRGRDVQAIVKELQVKVGKQLPLPDGYSINYGGAFENLQAASQRLLIAVPVALALIFLLLFFAFGEMKTATLVFTAIPLSAIGGVWGLWLRDMPFSISAGVGFIALFGVAVLNGIVLISEFKSGKKENDDTETVVLEGTRRRLRPVLMTATVASLGFLPMAISQGSGAEVQRPLATVVIFGIITATILTLFVIPILYLMTEKGMKITQLFRLKSLQKPKVLMLFLLPLVLHSQNTWTLEKMIKTAHEKNESMLAGGANIQSALYRKKAAGALDPINASAEYGAVNSYYTDNRFTVSQPLKMPGFIKAQKKLATAELELAKTDSIQQSIDLTFEIKRLYYLWLLKSEQLKRIQRMDSLWEQYALVGKRMYETGEQSLLQLSFMRMQLQDWRIKKQQVEWEYLNTLSELKVKVRDSSDWMPALVSAEYAGKTEMLDVYDVFANNALRKSSGLMQLQKEKWNMQKQGLYPEISMNYANMTIVGWQKINGEDRYFNSGYRFGMAGLGLKMPLWYKPYIAEVNAAKFQYIAARYAYDYDMFSVKNHIQLAAQEVKKLQYQVDGYKQYAIKSSDSVLMLAKLQMQKGNIGFLEWMLLLGSVQQTMENYYQAQQRCNEAWFRFENLINK